MRLLLVAALVVGLTSCTANQPAPSRPVPGPSTAQAPSGPGAAASQGANELQRRALALQAVADPANPLKLDAKEMTELSDSLRRLEMYRDRYDFRMAEAYASLKDYWRKGEDIAPPPGATPEGTFAVNAAKARTALAARAGGAKAQAAPYPAELQQPRTSLDPDAPDGPWDGVVAGEQRHTLQALPQFMEEVAPQLSPEQAAHALAELDQLEVLAREQEAAWKNVVSIAEAGKRKDMLGQVALGQDADLPPLLDKGIAWAHGAR